CFFFELPIVEAIDQHPAAVAATPELDQPEMWLDVRLAPGRMVTALVADDSSVNRRILAGLLESAGVRVITATGGQETIDLAKQHRPDVILLDLRLPDVDGLEVTRRLLAADSLAGTPIIA